MAPRPLILCVLAGGESRRFDQSKLDVHIDRQPLLAWQATQLSHWRPFGHAPSLWLSLPFGNTPLPPGHNLYAKTIRDSLPFQGPLAGIKSILDKTPDTGMIAFVPADMPLLQSNHLDMALSAMSQAPGATRACFIKHPGTDQERIEPFPMLMDLAHARQNVANALAKEIKGPSGLAKTPGTGWVTIPDSQSYAFQSINTPLDMQTIAKALNRAVTIGN
jgi:molybdopterin-guanine dinucleotide biosynthesis protein A